MNYKYYIFDEFLTDKEIKEINKKTRKIKEINKKTRKIKNFKKLKKIKKVLFYIFLYIISCLFVYWSLNQTIIY